MGRGPGSYLRMEPRAGGTRRGKDGGAIVITAAPGHDVGSSYTAFTPPVGNGVSRMDRERFPRAVRLTRVGKASIFSQFLCFALEDANREAACVRVFTAHHLQCEGFPPVFFRGPGWGALVLLSPRPLSSAMTVVGGPAF